MRPFSLLALLAWPRLRVHFRESRSITYVRNVRGCKDQAERIAEETRAGAEI